MKLTELIRQQIELMQHQLKHYEFQYNRLGQIDMLSGEGNTLLECINKAKGAITAFEAILEVIPEGKDIEL